MKASHVRTCLVPRNAVMTNETQTEYWVMKIVDNKLAVKVSVKKGIENDDMVEILNSGLSASDLVVSEGGYGLNDSTKIAVSSKR